MAKSYVKILPTEEALNNSSSAEDLHSEWSIGGKASYWGTVLNDTMLGHLTLVGGFSPSPANYQNNDHLITTFMLKIWKIPQNNIYSESLHVRITGGMFIKWLKEK